MKLIPNERYAELLDSERNLDKIESGWGDTKAAKKLRKDIEEAHEDEIDDLNSEHRAEIRQLNEKVEIAEDKAKDAQKVADKKAADAIEKALKEQKEANKKTETALADRESKVETRERDVEAREKRLTNRETALEKAQAEFDKAVTKHAEEVVKAREEGMATGEKKGYANGIADGVRNINELNKDAHDKVAAFGDKALDAVVKAAEKDVPAPTINAITLPGERVIETKTTKK